MRQREPRITKLSLKDLILYSIHHHRPANLKELATECRSYPNYRYSYSVIRHEIEKFEDAGLIALEPLGICKRPFLTKSGLELLRRPISHSSRSGNTVQLSLPLG
jgi:hypothetical protein